MKALSCVILGLTATIANPVQAETCQWKDSAGRTVVSDQPPPGNARDIRCSSGGTPSVSAAPASAPAPRSTAEKDMDFKKRQQDGKEKSEKSAQEEAAAANRKENCEKAQRQLAVIESGLRMSSVNADGERKILDDAERQAELERTRRVVSENCK